MKNNKGLTPIEVLLVLSIIAVLYSISFLQTTKSRNKVVLDSSLSLLINDIKSQQSQAMDGYKLGGDVNNYYGVYFESNRYILFHSSTYQSGLSTNLAVNLDNGISFSQISLPNNQLVFASSSGEIQNFDPGRNSIVFSTNVGDQKTVFLNREGVIYQVW